MVLRTGESLVRYIYSLKPEGIERYGNILHFLGNSLTSSNFIDITVLDDLSIDEGQVAEVISNLDRDRNIVPSSPMQRDNRKQSNKESTGEPVGSHHRHHRDFRGPRA